MEMTPKQWHRHYVEKISKYISENIGECDFVECGVKYGTSSVIMAKNIKGHGYLFDTWRGFPHFAKEDVYSDRRRTRLKKRLKGKNTEKDCKNSLKKNKVYKKCTMIKGDICKTVPDFVSNNNIKIGMMHIDTDLYEPANVSLESFWNMMLPNSVVFFHDYGDKHWPGIKRVVNSFMKSHESVSLLVFPKDQLSSCCIVNGDKSKLLEYIGVDNE